MPRPLRITGLRLLALIGASLPLQSSAQTSYCTPANTQGVPYFFHFSFSSANNTVVNGKTYSNSQNSSYTDNTTGGSSGTFLRYHRTGIHFAMYNPSPTVTYATAQVNMYIDLNGDFDFNDPYENPYAKPQSMTPYLSYNEYVYYSVPINTPPGNYRMRFAGSQAGAPSACGAFTGETEDFTITVGNNTAPVLSVPRTPFLNPLLSSQTATSGIAYDLLTNDSLGNRMISDADDLGTDRVPRGIAITGQTATNGAWEYRIGTGPWTPFGAVSATNALLLSQDGLVPGEPTTPVRIRFVPTGPGTPSFTYRAWDLTTGRTGGYADASTTGGTTAFSTAAQTVGTTVHSSIGASPLNIYFVGNDSTIRSSAYSRSSGTIVQQDALPNVSAQQRGNDIQVDRGTGMLYWTNTSSIYRSAADGSSTSELVSGLNASNYTIAVGDGNLFYQLYTSQQELYRIASDGSGAATSLLDGPGQLQTADIGGIDRMSYANNRLYLSIYDAVNFAPFIIAMDPDGTNIDTVYDGPNYPYGLHVVDGNVYWTESDGTAHHLMRRAVDGSGSPVSLASTTAYDLGLLIADPANARALVLSGRRVLQVDMNSGAVTRVLIPDGYPNAMAANIPSSVSALPVQAFAWNALAQGRIARLEWSAASNESGCSYEVERAADGATFRLLRSVPGAGAGSYMVLDEQPATGANYYRLKLTGRDGASSYSPVRRVDFGPGQASIFPNPVTGAGFRVELPAGTSYPQAYGIRDVAGRQLRSGTLSGPSTILSTAGLLPGQYVLNVAGTVVVLIVR